VSSTPRLLLAAACALVPLALAAPARADASSWFFAGAGPVAWRQGADATSYNISAALQFDVGVGTSPDAPFIIGGLFRLAPILGSGSDLGLLLRGATHGFQAGGFGVAIDGGAYARFWGDESAGFQGGITLGAPIGLTLSLLASVGSDDAKSFGATLGFDFLRLTVYRQTSLDAWPNPYPAQEARGPIGPGRFQF
jgi:hypothetical protein